MTSLEKIVASAALLALFASAAHADTRETQQKSLEKYTPYLQPPVEEFPFWSLHKWQLVGPLKVVVWSTIKDAWLVTVASPCPRLAWVHGIGLTSKQAHKVSSRFDEVIVGDDRCRIETIQPIDLAHMNEERDAAHK